MKIRNKINLTFLGLFVLFIVFISTVGGYFSSKIIESNEADFLKTTTQIERSSIQQWITAQKEKMGLILSESNSFCSYLLNEGDSPDAAKENNLDQCKNQLNALIGNNFENAFILNNNGELILNLEKEGDLKENFQQEDVFKKGREGVVFDDFYSQDEINFGISGPIKNKQTGSITGVLVVTPKKDNLFRVTSSFSDLFSSGRSYLINENSLLISPIEKVSDKTYLTTKVNHKNAVNCLKNLDAKKASGAKEYHSFNEKKVLGVHQGLPEQNWCIISEVNKDFIAREIRELQYLIAGSSLVILLIYFLLTILLSKSITKPLENLKKGVEKIKQGDYTYKVGIKSKDEIGRLSEAFDSMTKTIKKSRKEVDEKVKTQTKNLKERREELERQQKAILNILEDIQSEKEEAEKARERIKTILYSIGDGVFVVDKHKKIFIFNKMATKISGFQEEEVMGKNFQDVLKFVDEETGEQKENFVEKAIKKDGVIELEKGTALITKSGNKIPVADSVSPIKNEEGKNLGCVVVFRDISKDREIDKAKTEFVSLASHQLRTPLSTINWYAEMLLNGDAGEVNEDQKMYLNEIYKGNQRMVELVNALLNVSRIELGKLAVDIEKVDFRKVADTVINELKQKMKQKKIDFSKKYDEKLPKVNADPKLITIIFQNLLSNAVKYTPNKGKIGLIISKKEDHIFIEVSDTGYGIPEKQHNNIFQKMFRADNVREKDTEGTGLGLYLVKSIVDYAEGKIWFESKEDKGTKFFIEMPLKGMKVKKGSKKLAG